MSAPQPDVAAWVEWLTLAAIPHVGPRRLWQLVSELGSPEAVLRAGAARLRSVEGVDEVTIQSILDHRDALDMRDEAQGLADMGGRLVTFLDDDYPRALRRSDDPPPLFSVLGELRPLDEAAVAVVGSRNMTDYGRQMAETIAGDLAEAGLTIVSGFATGIDGVAHTAAVNRGGRTIGVLGCGLDITYPASHRSLRTRIVESGALISTFRVGEGPRAEHFPERNITLAALALAVVVIEAGEKSGALITAHRAMEQGRRVCAVPGDATRTNSRGVNLLIQEGARLVMSAADVLAELHGTLRTLLAELGAEAAIGADGLSPDLAAPSPQMLEGLDDDARELFRRIQAGPIQHDAMLRDPTLTVAQRERLPMLLMDLQLRELIDELPGKRYAARPAAAALTLPLEGEAP